MRKLATALTLLLGAGCASTPSYRPPIDLPNNGTFEGGVALETGANLTAAAPGAVAWALFRTEPGFDVFAAGRANPAITYDGQYAGVLVGGSAGVRYRLTQHFFEDMRFAAEAYGDFLQFDYSFRAPAVGPPLQRFITGVVRLPVAQRATENLWVYTAPTVGISIPLHDNPAAPFFGINEMPLGIVWTPLDYMSVVVEGGMQITLGGGYGGVAVMFHI